MLRSPNDRALDHDSLETPPASPQRQVAALRPLANGAGVLVARSLSRLLDRPLRVTSCRVVVAEPLGMLRDVEPDSTGPFGVRVPLRGDVPGWIAVQIPRARLGEVQEDLVRGLALPAPLRDQILDSALLEMGAIAAGSFTTVMSGVLQLDVNPMVPQLGLERPASPAAGAGAGNQAPAEVLLVHVQLADLQGGPLCNLLLVPDVPGLRRMVAILEEG